MNNKPLKKGTLCITTNTIYPENNNKFVTITNIDKMPSGNVGYGCESNSFLYSFDFNEGWKPVRILYFERHKLIPINDPDLTTEEEKPTFLSNEYRFKISKYVNPIAKYNYGMFCSDTEYSIIKERFTDFQKEVITDVSYVIWFKHRFALDDCLKFLKRY